MDTNPKTSYHRYIPTMVSLAFALIVTQLYSCRKIYADKPSPFAIGDKVRLKSIDPSRSFIPADGGVPPLVIISAYTIPEQRYWYYNTVDALGDTLIHVNNTQLKRY